MSGRCFSFNGCSRITFNASSSEVMPRTPQSWVVTRWGVHSNLTGVFVCCWVTINIDKIHLVRAWNSPKDQWRNAIIGHAITNHCSRKQMAHNHSPTYTHTRKNKDHNTQNTLRQNHFLVRFINPYPRIVTLPTIQLTLQAGRQYTRQRQSFFRL